MKIKIKTRKVIILRAGLSACPCRGPYILLFPVGVTAASKATLKITEGTVSCQLGLPESKRKEGGFGGGAREERNKGGQMRG